MGRLGESAMAHGWNGQADSEQDKTPKPSDPQFRAPIFPSRISSLPKQQPFQIPLAQRTKALHISPEPRLKPLPTSTQARLDKPLPSLNSPQMRLDKALPPAPLLHEIDETPPALPDDSPLIPACMLERYVPPLHMIPAYDPSAARKKLALLIASETPVLVPALRPISMTQSLPRPTEIVAVAGPPPPIPPRRSSRKERSGQSIPTDQKVVSSTSLISLGDWVAVDQKAASTTSLASLEESAIPDNKASSSSSLASIGQAPPLPPPRASSLRSASARAAISAAATSAPVVEVIKPRIEPSNLPLTRQPRVRSRSAQTPPTTKHIPSDRQPSQSFVSLSSILEDEAVPDMEATPEGSWALRRSKLRLARAKSQPKLRPKEGNGPWRSMGVMPYRCISLELE
jgi:hypothetical protein